MSGENRITPPGRGAEYAIVGAGAAVIGVSLVTWLGAAFAAVLAGGRVGGGLSDWLGVAVRLASGTAPSTAWGSLATGLPGATVYWLCTLAVGVVFVAATVGAVLLWRRWMPDPGRRVRFGQDTDAHQARVKDVGPLAIDSAAPPIGRMLLGRMVGGPLLATEDRERHPLTGAAARRQGHRGSVALVGPTGSGKTTLAISAINTWDGPVVAISVKRDLYDKTIAARTERGDVAVFDPGGVTGVPTARWSPLGATTTSSGALRTGRALSQAIPKSGVTNAEYWAEHGEALLGAFMCVAGLARLLREPDGSAKYQVGMVELARWVRTLAGISDPTINAILGEGLDDFQPLEVQLLAQHASVTFVGLDKEDHKIRSSVYSTAVLALKPWLEPAVGHSASARAGVSYDRMDGDDTPQFVDLDWLMGERDDGKGNTLYLAAPSAEFERLSPVLGGLLADLKDTIHAWDISGKKLDKPLMIVIDEAAQLQIGWLPAEVSTIAALGAFFVTCWQNLAQVNYRYGPLADAVLSGHRTKCFFAGVDDPTTLRYLATVLGQEHVKAFGRSQDVPNMRSDRSHGRRSFSESLHKEDFAPANAIRQMYPGEAILLHGTLPPIHLSSIIDPGEVDRPLRSYHRRSGRG